ncbi:hypothetical protein RBH29_14835 [Herbivorax sp. ANBcel31]|uniref:hypothetical protein n=1 Tax=Herbivorax sp. ANBcel31 TaxID=3069754 RepID=UPI0027B1246A|nr:hypothetical protein [Herbivorax sp. ANBcel31]MDQ2087703.1 hypothetical protein [Herbivorax sp. ANBcel31]
MANLGLVIFCDKKEGTTKLKFLKRIILKIKDFFSKEFVCFPIKKVKVNKDLNIYFIKLKYTLDEISEFKHFKIKKFKKNIQKHLTENFLDKCIFPAFAPENLEFDSCIKNPFSGYFIYTALLVSILEIIASKKGVSVKEFDIGIIQGDNHKLFYSYIKILSPLVKFITIITNKKEYVQEKIEEVYDETGLSIRVTDDIESGLDNIDIVINLGDVGKFKKDKKIKSKAIVINYGNAKSDGTMFDNIIIDGISIQFDNSLETILNQNAIRCFTKIELASMIFCHKKSICANINKNNVDNKIIDDIFSHFIKSGCKITGFTGRFQGIEDKNLELRI